MTRVLLTGGSGFIAAHVLERLLEQGHSVVTTVRSQAKADKIREAHPKIPASRLSFAIVEDIAQPDAFSEAVKSDPPFEAVIHTASPFHYNVTDVQKQLLDPAIIGTTGILKSVKKSAPTVKRVVITSSFAAIMDSPKGTWPGHTYSEKDWNPISPKEATLDPSNGYRASKTFAEKAAWEFIEKEKPNFSLTTMCPPMVYGPVAHYLNSLDSLNTSNQRARSLMTGEWKDGCPPTGTFLWTDVRDLALAHVKAMETPEAGDKRFFVTSGYFCNDDLAEIIRKNFPVLEDKLPKKGAGEGGMPSKIFKFDNSRVRNELGIKFRSLEDSITDLVKSLQAIGA